MVADPRGQATWPERASDVHVISPAGIHPAQSADLNASFDRGFHDQGVGAVFRLYVPGFTHALKYRMIRFFLHEGEIVYLFSIQRCAGGR